MAQECDKSSLYKELHWIETIKKFKKEEKVKMPITLSDRAAIIARMDSQFNSDIQLRRDLVKMEKRAKDVVTNCRLYQKVNFENFEKYNGAPLRVFDWYTLKWWSLTVFQIISKSTGDNIFILVRNNSMDFIWHHLDFKQNINSRFM